MEIKRHELKDLGMRETADGNYVLYSDVSDILFCEAIAGRMLKLTCEICEITHHDEVILQVHLDGGDDLEFSGATRKEAYKQAEVWVKWCEEIKPMAEAMLVLANHCSKMIACDSRCDYYHPCQGRNPREWALATVVNNAKYTGPGR